MDTLIGKVNEIQEGLTNIQDTAENDGDNNLVRYTAGLISEICEVQAVLRARDHEKHPLNTTAALNKLSLIDFLSRKVNSSMGLRIQEEVAELRKGIEAGLEKHPLSPQEYARNAYWLMFEQWIADDSTIHQPKGMTQLGKALIAFGTNLDEFHMQIIEGVKARGAAG